MLWLTQTITQWKLARKFLNKSVIDHIHHKYFFIICIKSLNILFVIRNLKFSFDIQSKNLIYWNITDNIVILNIQFYIYPIL